MYTKKHGFVLKRPAITYFESVDNSVQIDII